MEGSTGGRSDSTCTCSRPEGQDLRWGEQRRRWASLTHVRGGRCQERGPAQDFTGQGRGQEVGCQPCHRIQHDAGRRCIRAAHSQRHAHGDHRSRAQRRSGTIHRGPLDPNRSACRPGPRDPGDTQSHGRKACRRRRERHWRRWPGSVGHGAIARQGSSDRGQLDCVGGQGFRYRPVARSMDRNLSASTGWPHARGTDRSAHWTEGRVRALGAMESGAYQ